MATNIDTADSRKLQRTNPPLTLLNLPPELKTKIYEYVFNEALLDIKTGAHGKKATYQRGSRSITVVCRQMRAEARPIFLAQTTLYIRNFRAFELFSSFVHPSEVFSRATRVKIWLHSNMYPLADYPPLIHGLTSLQHLLIEKSSNTLRHHNVIESSELQDTQPSTYIFDLADKMAITQIGRPDQVVRALQLPDHVKVSTRFHIFLPMSCIRKYCRHWIIDPESRTFEKHDWIPYNRAWRRSVGQIRY